MTAQPIPLNVGDSAPDFSLRNAQGETISLSDYRGKNVVVYFYPKAATLDAPSRPAISVTT